MGGKDMTKLERVDTKMNVADVYTKQLGQLLFHRHCDYLMGRVPSSYSAVHQTLRDRCQQTKFSRGDTTGKGSGPVCKLPQTTAAAAARLYTDGDVCIWDIVTEHWRRR